MCARECSMCKLCLFVVLSILLLRVVYLRQCQLVTELIKHTPAQLLAAIYLHLRTHTPLTCHGSTSFAAESERPNFCVFWTRLHFDLWLRNILR